MSELKMPQINNVCLSGRLVWDAELKTGASGANYARTRIAVDEGFGEKKTTSFIACVAFGKVAERLSSLTKGTPVYVEGRIRVNKREKGDAVEEYAEITLYRIDSLCWGDEPRDTSQVPPRASQSAHDTAKSNGYAPEPPEDDIPF